MNYQRIVQNTIALVVLFFLVLCIWYGYKAGFAIAQTRFISLNTRALQKGLDYFYQDQNRYPTEAEFKNTELMKRYFVNFPVPNETIASCGPSITYASYRQLSFTLDFCIPRSTGNFIKGKNSVTEKSPL